MPVLAWDPGSVCLVPGSALVPEAEAPDTPV